MDDIVKEKIRSIDGAVHNRIEKNLEDYSQIIGTVERLKIILSDYSELDTKNILPMTGKNRALRNIFKALAFPGDQILAFGIYNSGNQEAIADHYGLTWRNVYPKTPFAAFPEDLTHAIEANTKLIYISNPNRTTGAIFSDFEIASVLESNRNGFVIVDESQFEYYQSSCANLIEHYDNLIVLRSFSEGFELKNSVCEYFLSSEENIRKLKRTNGENYSLPILESAILALGVINREKARWNQIHENMIYLSVRLRSLGITNRISPADFILVRVNNPVMAADFLKSNNHAAVNLSEYFGLENYISIPVSDDNNSHSLISSFEKMPAAYYRFGKSSRLKLTLVRKTAEESDSNSVGQLHSFENKPEEIS